MGQYVQTMHMLTKPQVFYDENHKTALSYQNTLYLTQAQRKQLALYCGHTLVRKHDPLSVINSEETLHLAEATRLKMNEKKIDPIVKEKRVNIKPIDYGSLNELYKHYVPQKQLSVEQNFWLPISKIVSDQTLVQPEPIQNVLPRELPSISVVKNSFLKMKRQLNDFDMVIKVRTKVTGQNEGTLRFEHIRKAFEKDCVEIEKKELLIENDLLFERIISQDIVCTAMHSYDDLVKYAETEQIQQTKESFQHDKPCTNQDAPEFLAFFEIDDLKAQLHAKNTSISMLKEHISTLKGKSVSDCITSINNANVIALGMFKLDLEPLSPKLRKNREAHVDYLKQTKEHADTLCEIVEKSRALKPLDKSLEYACKFTIHIQELLVYVSSTCPSSRNESEKLVIVTPMNKKKQVRFAKPRVNSYTHTNGSKMISSSNHKNKKVEDHPRNVKTSLNKKNCISVCNATKSGKINKKKEWKPTGKVFTNVRHR
ncbi:hypothetical protein Tco_1381986 [Tanacetum coccineum]